MYCHRSSLKTFFGKFYFECKTKVWENYNDLSIVHTLAIRKTFFSLNCLLFSSGLSHTTNSVSEGLFLNHRKESRKLKQNTVKPVYNDHPRDPKIVADVDRWLLLRGRLCCMDLIGFWLDLAWFAVLQEWDPAYNEETLYCFSLSKSFIYLGLKIVHFQVKQKCWNFNLFLSWFLDNLSFLLNVDEYLGIKISIGIWNILSHQYERQLKAEQSYKRNLV